MNKLLCFFLFMTSSTLCIGQVTLHGNVINELSIPIEYANIIELKNDSTFISGCVSDSTGLFYLDVHKEAYFIKVSCIGYKTIIIPIKYFNGKFIMQKDIKELTEIIVKTHPVTYKNSDEGLIANIQNSVLSKLGETTKVLEQLPYINVNGNKIEVLGKGAAVIYVNNRQIRDNNELTGIPSNQIKNIQIITNPGSQYPSSVNAVIRITTINQNGEGLTGFIQSTGKERTLFSHSDYMSMNYRVNELDLFGSVNYIEDKLKENQTNFLKFSSVNSENYSTQHDKQNFLISTLGTNYITPNSKLSLGGIYSYSRTINTPFNQLSVYYSSDKNGMHNFVNSLNQNNFGGIHYGNAYLRYNFENKSTLSIDLSYVNLDIHTKLETTENENDDLQTVSSFTKRKSQMAAEEIKFSIPTSIGYFTVGNEYTYTNSEQNFRLTNTDIDNFLSSNKNLSCQHALGIFTEYQKSWENWKTNFGLRYELVLFDYYLNNIHQAEQSKIYKNIMPSISIEYNKKGLLAALSFRPTINRPSYQELRASLSFSNRYHYEGGNPSLQPSYKYDLGIRLGYNNLLFTSNFIYYKNAIMYYNYVDASSNATVSSFINHNLKELILTATYSPIIAWWRPTITAYSHFQYLNYKNCNYYHPIFSYSIKNILSLPAFVYFTVNLEGQSPGNSMLRYIKENFELSATLSRKFKHFFAEIGIKDIFKTKRESWYFKCNDLLSNKWQKADSRYVYITLQYNFNAVRSKYQGGQSGNSERDRL